MWTCQSKPTSKTGVNKILTRTVHKYYLTNKNKKYHCKHITNIFIIIILLLLSTFFADKAVTGYLTASYYLFDIVTKSSRFYPHTKKVKNQHDFLVHQRARSKKDTRGRESS